MCFLYLVISNNALIFLHRCSTGASGYIGGDILNLLKSTHPDYTVSILVRDSDKATAISKEYPDVRVVLGDLDSAALLEQEASQADVVIRK